MATTNMLEQGTLDGDSGISHEQNIVTPRISWSKSSSELPLFTIRNIEQHRKLSGKIKGLPIEKTLVRGRKFMREGYLKTNSMLDRFSEKDLKQK